MCVLLGFCAARLAGLRPVAGILASLLVLVSTTQAGVILSGTGVSAAGNPIAASATLSISGDTLTLLLENTSPVDSAEKADVLSSFYFDIVGASGRPLLAYESAAGYVWQVKSDALDIPYNYTPPAVAGGAGDYVQATGSTPHVISDLMATKANDRTWQFRTMDASLPPLLGFGVGTVGSSVLSPNGFDPAIVGPPGNQQIAFGIYKDGNIQPVGQPMQDQFLVLNQAVFTFSGLTGFTEADIGPDATFGFGTGPDSVISLPEPGAWQLATGALITAGVSLLRHTRRRTLSAAAIASLLALGAVALMPVAEADAIVVDDAFDFSAGPEGWTAEPVGNLGYLPPADRQWQHGSGQWSVEWSPVFGPLVATGNHLTSPAIDAAEKVGGIAVDVIRISLAHMFDFGALPQGATVPPSAGQISYSVNGGPFVGIPLAAFHSGSIDDPQPQFTPPIDPFPPGMVDQTTLVLPGFVPPVGGYPELFPLVNGGASFTGTTTGFAAAAGVFVPSIATILIEPTVLTDFRVRLTNANLGSVCHGSGVWNVGYVQVDFAAPEPAGRELAGCAAALAGLRGLRCRLSPPRAGGPLTTDPPGRA
jgi:uncharacterized protein YunC (DUF1805 family)